MLLTSAVVPGPPALVAELMGSAAGELDDLRDAIDRAVGGVVSALSAPSAPSALSRESPPPGSASASVGLVVVGAGKPGEFDASGPVSFASFGRDVTIPALVAGQVGDRELPTPIMVARYLASRDIAAHPEHAALWATARWITTSGPDAQALGETLGAPDTRIGLLLMADGAACHGPKAPRAQDDRAKQYDDAVCAALASGQPGRLGQIDRSLGDQLGATGAAVWPVLVAAAGATQPATEPGTESATESGTESATEHEGATGPGQIAEVLWTGAPYGVGWTVASWSRPCR